MALSEQTQKRMTVALNSCFDSQEVTALLTAIGELVAANNSMRAAAPNISMYISGLYYDQSFAGNVSAPSYTGVADTIVLSPFFSAVDVPVNEFSISVATGVAATNARVLVYDSDINYKPDNKVFESGDLSTATSSSSQSAAASFTFKANNLYWIGVHTSGAAALRATRDWSLVPLGFADALYATNMNTAVRKVVTYGSAPSKWGFTVNDLFSSVAPSVRFKVA